MDLVVWQRALDFAQAVYQATASFPKSEVFGLTSQLRRSAVSVASNIAEGSARSSTREFIHFLKVARASLAEAHTQTLLSHRVGYLPEDGFVALNEAMGELGRLINAVLSGLQRRLSASSGP